MGKIIYTSGKYTSDGSLLEVTKNIELARSYAIKIWNLGGACLCPHLNTAHFDYFSTAPYEAYMEFDLRIIEACDALFMLPGWADSKGAIKERMRAIELGKVILYNDHELEKYLSEH